MSPAPPPIGLYLHFPFCAYKCGYCDFNSWVEQAEEPQVQWLNALKKELLFWKRHGLDRFTVDTIFMGGGTPSLLREKLWFDLANFLRANLTFASQCEWTIEANPETLTRELLQNFSTAGVNRISVGIQSFEEKFLRRLERGATPAANRQALELISEYWPGRWSLDLMFGLPGQTQQEWEKDLTTALRFGPQHISAYQLTLTTEKSKNWQQPLEGDLLNYFRTGREVCAKQGLLPYEISNFSVPGEECLHNLKYWRVEPFLGLGPGAYSLLPAELLISAGEFEFGAHYKTPTKFASWQASVEQNLSDRNLEARTMENHLNEILLVGLRLESGIDLRKLEGQFDGHSEKLFNWAKLTPLQNLVELTPTHLRATPRGREILDETIVQVSQALL